MKSYLMGIAFSVFMAAASVSCTCDDNELSRAEALLRAKEYVAGMTDNYDFSEGEPELISEVRDQISKTWSFRFRSGKCEFIVTTDRCEATDISGLNDACRTK